MRLLENQTAPVNQSRRAAASPSSGGSPMMVMVFGAVIFAGYMFTNEKTPATSNEVRGVSHSQVYAAPTPNLNNGPTGPGGYFPQLEPTTDAAPQTDFQIGDPQDAQKLQQYLEGELKRIVPEAAEFGPPAEVAGQSLGLEFDQLLNQ